MRLLRSFRLRIALISTVIAGVVLVMYGTWARVAVRSATIERVDIQIGKLAWRHLRRGGPGEWEKVGESLEVFYGDEAASTFTMLALDRHGDVAYQSSNWPEGVSPNDILALRRPPLNRDGEPPPIPPHLPRAEMRNESWSDPLDPRDRRRDRDRDREPPHPPVFFTWGEGNQTWRVAVLSGPHDTVALGLNLEYADWEGRRVGNTLLYATVVGLILIAGGGYFVAGRALRPIRVLSGTIQRITSHDLAERMPLTSEDAEFQRLINVFNGMLDRLEKSFQQATRFSADAAHELKTPLAILQGMLEEGIQKASPGSPEQERYSELLETVQRLKSNTRKLLLLSQADAGQLSLRHDPVDLTEMVEEAFEDVSVLAPEIPVERRLEADVLVSGDRDLLRQVVQNLIQNAVQHCQGVNGENGLISVELESENNAARLTISNTGETIPESDRQRIFERFYRVDQSRARERGGAGLGLSLAREIARAHHGDLVLEESPAGTTAFTLTVPKA